MCLAEAGERRRQRDLDARAVPASNPSPTASADPAATVAIRVAGPLADSRR
jgi:hypothetical protein